MNGESGADCPHLHVLAYVTGKTICVDCRRVFDASEMPPRLLNQPAEAAKFVAVRRVVMRGGKHIAEAASSTLARRIANALNRYTPHSRKGY